MILPPKHATIELIPTKQPRPRTTSWRPVNRSQHRPENMLTPAPRSRKRRPSLSETDESPSVDAAIDIFQKSQSSVMVSLPPTGCFDTLVQRVEETMALVDKTGISLAHKAKRRKTVARRLSERKCGDNLSLCAIGRQYNILIALSSDRAITKSSTDRLQKQHSPPAPTEQFSPMLHAMISEVEAESQNKTTATRTEHTAEEGSDDKPEILAVEREYSALKIRIVKASGRNGGYIIANCRDGNWMLELGVRLDREERERRERGEGGGCEAGKNGKETEMEMEMESEECEVVVEFDEKGCMLDDRPHDGYIDQQRPTSSIYI